MTFHHIAGNEAFRLGGRRLSPVYGAMHGPAPTRRRRGLVDWRTVGLVALSAILLIAMMARP